MAHKLEKEVKKRWGLTIALVLFVFIIMIAAMLLAGLALLILDSTSIISIIDKSPEDIGSWGMMSRFIISLMTISVLLGTTITAFFSRTALKPLRKVIVATRKIADGDFNTRVNLKGIYELEELSHSFNKMALELSSIETLRRDFINNISHEFKTPVTSICGFAVLLKEGRLSEEERLEYLEIIIAESERLAALSTNVLNLAKYENLEIITDKSTFWLDEQIRRVIVLIEPRWAAKEINMDVELDAIKFTGSEDLTQQIWLNLIDNAIKFSNTGGTVSIRLVEWNEGVRFTIQDEGIGMDVHTIARVFDKFYQGDASRFKAGNGIGLAIVKQIVDISGGSIEARGKLDEGSEFIVWLPVK